MSKSIEFFENCKKFNEVLRRISNCIDAFFNTKGHFFYLSDVLFFCFLELGACKLACWQCAQKSKCFTWNIELRLAINSSNGGILRARNNLPFPPRMRDDLFILWPLFICFIFWTALKTTNRQCVTCYCIVICFCLRPTLRWNVRLSCWFWCCVSRETICKLRDLSPARWKVCLSLLTTPLPKGRPNPCTSCIIAIFVLQCYAFSASLVHLSFLPLPPLMRFFCPLWARFLCLPSLSWLPLLFPWLPIAFLHHRRFCNLNNSCAYGVISLYKPFV